MIELGESRLPSAFNRALMGYLTMADRKIIRVASTVDS